MQPADMEKIETPVIKTGRSFRTNKKRGHN